MYSVITAWIGAKHVLYHAKNGEKAEIMQTSDALLMPVIGSGVLFGLYLLIRYAPKNIMDLIISFYLAAVALFSLNAVVKHYMRPNILTGLLCIGVVACYVAYQSWIANDVLAFALAIVAIETVPLNSFTTSFVMLIGLFFYDIFWVFGTEVMIVVATNINGPIKVLFPQNIFGDHNKKSILGLGDIVVPSFFIGQVLTFSQLYAKRGNVYFNVAIVAYALSLINTMIVLNIFKKGQPALLFIVPWLLLTFCATAVYYKDVHMAFSFDLSRVQANTPATPSPQSTGRDGVSNSRNSSDSKNDNKSKHGKKNEPKVIRDEAGDSSALLLGRRTMSLVVNLFGYGMNKESIARKKRIPKARRSAKQATLPDTASVDTAETI